MALSQKGALGLLGGVAVAAAAAAALLMTQSKPAPLAPPQQQAAIATTSAADKPADVCATGVSLTADDIAGDWSEAFTGAKVTIAKGGSGFILHGTHDWDGSFTGGEITFTRKPLAAEMQHSAPAWARAAIQGQVEWSMTLTAVLAEGIKHLCGPWYPGLVKIATQSGQAQGSVSLAGKGNPVMVDYTAQPPAILRVVELDNQTGFAAQGIPLFPYPYPLPPQKPRKDYVPEEYESVFYAENPYLPETEIYNPSHLAQYQRGPNGNLYATHQRRTLYVVGQGLPHKLSEAIDIAAGLGGHGLVYRPLAVANDANPQTNPQYADLLARGKKAALLNVNNSQTRDMIEHGDAMLLTVDFNATDVLPGYKDFRINKIEGNSEWLMRFGDDRALISFGRRIGFGEYELTDNLYLPERTFIEIRTESALPVDKIDLHVAVNGNAVSWAGAPTLTATRVPSDPTGTLYRTAFIELVEAGNPPSASEPGVTYLTVKPNDRLDVRLDDPGLFAATERPATVYDDPADTSMAWKSALQSAAAAAGIQTGDWSQLPGQKATEVSNTLITGHLVKGLVQQYVPSPIIGAVDYVRGRMGKGPLIPTKTSTSISVGDLAALILFRDTFLRRLEQANKSDLLPHTGDAADLRGLRDALKPSAWDSKSAWSYLRVSCPGESGSAVSTVHSCPFSDALDDNYLKQHFPNNEIGADLWSVTATAEALQEYKTAVNAAIQKLQGLKDDDAEGMLEFLAADCTSESLDLPCGYKALRPIILPNMMRRLELDQQDDLVDPGKRGYRHVWVPDLSARYALRNLYTLISATKSQANYAAADRNLAVAVVMAATAPVLAELGAAGELAAAVLNQGGYSVIAMGGEIPDYLRIRQEIKFAQGASLVLGQERLSTAMLEQDQFVKGLLQKTGLSLAGDVVGMHLSVAGVRAAALEQEIKQVRLELLLSRLSRQDKTALVNVIARAELLEETQNLKVMGDFEKDMAEAGDTMRQSPVPPSEQSTLKATGDPAPKFPNEELEAPPQEQIADAQAESPKAPAEPASRYELFESATEKKLPESVLADLKNQPIPEATGNFTFKGLFNGEVVEFKLGAKIGAESKWARVYDLIEPKLPGCEAGCVIKLYGVDPEGVAAAADIVKGSRLLGDDIPQPKFINPDGTSTSPSPFLVQQKLKFGAVENCTLCNFDPKKYRAAVEARFANDPALGDALLELMAKVKDKGVTWTDANLPNMYFQKTGSKWVGGILDTDFMVIHADRAGRLGKYIAEAEWKTVISDYVGSMARTRQTAENSLLRKWMKTLAERFPTNKAYQMPPNWLSQDQRNRLLTSFQNDRNGNDMWTYFENNPGPYFPDAEFLTEKMLEKKGYIRYDPVEDDWYGIFIDPGKKLDRAKFKRYFPKMFNEDREAPIDFSKPFYKSSRLEGARIVKFAEAQTPRNRVQAGRMRHAA